MPAVDRSKYLVQAGWEDAAHLDNAAKEEMLASTPPYLRAARSKGTPSLGSGAIYPIDQDEFVIPPFSIPAHFAKGYGLDVGWNRTAALWGAHDRDSDVVYVYTEHYRGQAEPSIHADAIKARGEWMVGAIDPASRGRSQKDGEQLLASYRELGLNLVMAINAVEAGLLEVWQRISSGRLKIFSNCTNTLAEHRIYRRDEKGAIVKKNDHAMDALRYLMMTLGLVMQTKPVPRKGSSGFRPADKSTGY